MKTVSLIFFYIFTSLVFHLSQADHNFDISSLVKGFGYLFEDHTVNTDDGYILKLHRVPLSISSTTITNRPPVLVMHGLLGSSADFLHIGEGKSLPLRLVDAGYDVWLGNNRGNTWGRNHDTLKPDQNASFWDFSFHEFGVKDAPAIIDYILNKTKVEKLSLIGHSTGATQFFVMTTSKPEYNYKINVMAALAPIVYIGHAENAILRLIDSNSYKAITIFQENQNMTTEFLIHNVPDSDIGKLCGDGSKYQELCIGLLFFFTGFDNDQLENSLLPQFLRTFPAGTSIKHLNHFLQLKVSGKFRQFDHGEQENLALYNNTVPPAYNLKKVTVPTGIFYGKNDLIVAQQDIEQLASELQNVIVHQPLDYEKFNHIDFLLAKDVDEMANYYIINLLNKYNNLSEVTSTSLTTTTTPTTSPTRVTSPSIETTPSIETSPSGATDPSGETSTGHSTTQKGSSVINIPSLYAIVTNILIGIVLYANLSV